MKRTSLFLAVLLSTNVAKAEMLTSNHLYRYAQNKNYQALQKFSKWINITNKNKDTAICLALKDNNIEAYKLLLRYGANPRPSCLARINKYNNTNKNYHTSSSNSETFLGMGTTGWSITGGLLAAGGIAAVAGGGGGGGSSSGRKSGDSGGSSSGSGGNDKNDTSYLDKEPITDQDNGQEIVGKTATNQDPQTNNQYIANSNNGTIKKIVETENNVVGVASETAFVANATSFEGKSKADITIAQRGSGDIYGIKGPQSRHVNVIPEDEDDEEEGSVYNAVSAGGRAEGNITIRNTGKGTGNIYGMQSNADNIYIANAEADAEPGSATVTANILIENLNSDKNVYGISSNSDATNAEVDSKAKAEGYINIKNTGNGDVYGIKAVKETYNIDATEQGEAVARIDITNNGNGNVYGITNDADLYNIKAGHDMDSYEEDDAAKAEAIINIENTGTGKVYGLKSSFNIFNAYSFLDSNAESKVRISNNGTGDAYGIYGYNIKNAYAFSKDENHHATAKGYVNILNKSSGTAYGMYGRNVQNTSSGSDMTSTIEMVNVDKNSPTALAVGIYSKDGSITSSGDIKIHNLGNGTAVGIYADGSTTAINTGSITIDRTAYTDDKSTDNTSDDKTYTAASAKGGIAIGIYGAEGSNITNNGTIIIKGAENAYGIYSEGGNVTNTGTITIDADTISNNSTENGKHIVLNGGTLLQDGKLVVGANSCRNGFIEYNGVCYEELSCASDKHQEENKCVCNAGLFEQNGICYEDLNCETNRHQEGNICVCNEGYIDQNGACYAELNCGEHGYQQVDKCVCENGYNFTNGACRKTIIGSNNQVNNSSIRIDNNDDSNIYGMYYKGSLELISINNAKEKSGNITIINDGNGDVYGMYATIDIGSTAYISNSKMKGSVGYITITNTGNGDVYGMYGDRDSYLNNVDDGDGRIVINNNGNGNIYGIYGFHAENAFGSLDAKGIINISNNGEGNIYGLYAISQAYNARSKSTGNIRILNNKIASRNDIYGIYGKEWAVSSYGGSSKISIINKGNGRTFGVYGEKIAASYKSNDLTSFIEIANKGNGLAIGMYGRTLVNNEIQIRIHNLGNGIAIGMYVDHFNSLNDAEAINNGTIIIDRESYIDDNLTTDTSDDTLYTATSINGGKAIGIYGSKNTKITNYGLIKIKNADEAYGIYSEGGAVLNTGTITIDDDTISNNSTANGKHIVLNGGTLFQDGKLIAQQSSTLNLDDAELSSIYQAKDYVFNLDTIGGNVVATENANFEVHGAISGKLTMSSDIVSKGFEDLYTTKNTIDAQDTSNLNLYSQSVLFDASLAENNSDVNLKMKAFDEVVENKSLADFLQSNYALENNETFYNTLKKQETVASLNEALNELTGQKLFSRFADEDLMMMRELTFDMNNKLFMNNDNHLETSGNISTFNFNGNSGSNSRYALINQNYGKYKLGLNYGFADVRSYDDDDDNRREEMMFHMGMPISYHKKGFKFITTPHIGYASGTYDRKGLNSENYDGHIDKTMFGLMNEVRYPIAFDKWTIAPSAEFNVVNYATKGHEKGGTNPLKLDLQHNYSVEAGLGLYANTERKLGKNAKLSFIGGIAMYHEFADPYKLSIGMDGMSGKFDIRDENRGNNRAVLRTGLKFANRNMSLGANVMSYIDREYRTNATLDFKYGF